MTHTKFANIRWSAIYLTIVLLLVGPLGEQVARAQKLTPQLSKAIEAARLGKATTGQQALLFQNNNVINSARLNGWIPDSSYQAVQQNYASLNQKIAKQAAESAGASFQVQQSTSSQYSPGTDSDYIVQAKSKDPVGQISKMQDNYNNGVNAYLKEALEAEGMNFQARQDWHNRLDVDFMADPKHVTQDQFEKIAKLNNDAYKRRDAAEFERSSRAGNGVKITPGQFTGYAQEMQEFAKKKQKTMERFRKNPSLLNDPTEMAEYHRLMAQEQKYISRIESAKDSLRKQEGLKSTKKPQGPPVYEMRVNKDGTATLRKRQSGTVASRGSQRSFTNRTETINASALADNSMNRAVTELADSMAEAAKKNPKKWPNASAQIAQITENMPPAQKGQLIEKIRFEHGDDIARSVAGEMRERIRASRPTKLQRLDNSLKTALNVTDDLSELRGLRRSLNETAGKALGGLDNFSTLGTAVELKDAADQARIYVQSLQQAMDPNLTDEEADALFRKAEQASWTLAKNGTLGALTEAIPTVGAIYAGWSLGFDGTRYVLENTETGRMIDRKAEEFFDRHQRAIATTGARLTEFLGGESDRMKGENRLRDLEAAYWRALRKGRIRMKPGVRTLDIAALIRDGDLSGIRDLIEPGPNASKSTNERLAQTEAKETKATKKPKPDPNSDLEFIPQTFEPNSNGLSMEERLRALERKGESAFGPAERSGTGGIGTQTDSTGASSKSSSNYRQRAEQLAGGRRATSKTPSYQNRAQQIDQIAAARERAEEIRQEQIRQEQLRQQQIYAQQLAEWQRQQAIAAHQHQQEQLRQQAIARWQQEQQRQAQIRWNQQQAYQQLLAQQRQRQRQPTQTTGQTNGWGGWKLPDLTPANYDGSIMGGFGPDVPNGRFYKLNDIPGSSGR